MNRLSTFCLGSRRGGILRAAIGMLCFASAAGALGWMLLTPRVLRSELEARTGFPVEMRSLTSNPLAGSMRGEGVVVGNPDSFGGGGPMLEIRRFEAQADVPALGRGELRVERLDIEIARANLVIDERGRLNLRVFADRLLAVEEGTAAMPFHAKRARVVIDEIDFVDYSRPMPTSRSLRPLLDVEVHDAQSIAEVLEPLVELGHRVGALPRQ